jgi:alpha-amylase/alpha-mannosidase (GH57 family)
LIYWAQLFHFYQPPIQTPAVLERICNESYRPLLNVLHQNQHAKATLNINGVLLEMLHDCGHRDIIKSLRLLGEKRQVEFTGSGKYHPILPLLPPFERKRQIELNADSGTHFLGKVYKPKGFFPPEMCYSSDILSEVIASGHQWMIVSGIACQNPWPTDKVYQVERDGKKLAVLFRDDILSNKVSFKQIGPQDFIEHLKQMRKDKQNAYVITAMDAETYGHHLQNWEELFLATVYGQLSPTGKTPGGINRVEAQFINEQPVVVCPACDTEFLVVSSGELPPVGYVTCPSCEAELVVDFKGSKKEGAEKTSKSTPQAKRPEQAVADIKIVTISELLEIFPRGEAVELKPSSWSTSAEDIAAGNPYPLWLDKDNEIHRLQWEHLHICIEMVNKAQECGGNDECRLFGRIARDLLDIAEYSCQFWWASRKPMWDINLIHTGLMS